MGYAWTDWPSEVLSTLRRGAVIPAHPLALDANRKLDRQRQKALSRYYIDAGAGGLAVGVHTTQFAIRDVGLYEPVLRLAAEEAAARTTKPIMIAGAIGRTDQAVAEARIARGLGYHAVLLSLAAWKGAEAADWQADDYGRLSGPWLDGDRVMVAEYWRRERVTKTILALSDGQVVEEGVYAAQKAMFDALGVKVIGRPRQVGGQKVTQRILTGAEVLETVDWAGRFIPIVPVYGEELMVDGRRRLRLRRGAIPRRRVRGAFDKSGDVGRPRGNANSRRTGRPGSARRSRPP